MSASCHVLVLSLIMDVMGEHGWQAAQAETPQLRQAFWQGSLLHLFLQADRPAS